MTELQTAILSRLDALAAKNGVSPPSLSRLTYRERWQLSRSLAPVFQVDAKSVFDAIESLAQHNSV